MAIALELTTIVSNIAALSISGVTVLDMGEIPETASERKPTLFPNPMGFISDFEAARMSQKADGEPKMDVRYTLNYRFCHSPAGSLRSLGQGYSKMVTKAVDIINKILENDDLEGVVDMTMGATTFSGAVADPAGNMWHGCDLAFRILEHTD